MKAELAQKEAPAPKRYVVLAENGLFKNGKAYEKGQVLSVGEELPHSSISAFVEAGDIKEVE